MESLFSKSVVSPSSKRAHRIDSSSDENSSVDDDDEEEEEESPLIHCFFDIAVDSSASSSSR
jgi:hypothetical protein